FQARDPDLFNPLPTVQSICNVLHARVPQTCTYKRVRLLVAKDASIRVEFTELVPAPAQGFVTLDEAVSNASADTAAAAAAAATRTRAIVLDTTPLPCPTAHPFLLNKTTDRAIYNAARANAGVVGADGDHGPFDVVLWNAHGQVTETSIANIAVQ
ncbi:hypothetical protein BX666DRAFT_1812756, partial [Dichotomocladium elegans]